jgi:hypothetical protein
MTVSDNGFRMTASGSRFPNHLLGALEKTVPGAFEKTAPGAPAAVSLLYCSSD